ncbi:hypothetical protein [Methylobacterium sp. Leaf89]|uniref:hypothetical protein n=1 Tax=Methylobacterium sp. Leaf89 TaxID=1736245 RepID=UPI001FCDCA50|nr:hypothetical protein [Methylobacterium sp. Leaf89]
MACRCKLRANGTRQILAYLVPGDFCISIPACSTAGTTRSRAFRPAASRAWVSRPSGTSSGSRPRWSRPCVGRTSWTTRSCASGS